MERSPYSEGESLYLLLPDRSFAKEYTIAASSFSISKDIQITSIDTSIEDGRNSFLKINASMYSVELNRLVRFFNYLACQRLDSDIQVLKELMNKIISELENPTMVSKTEFYNTKLIAKDDSRDMEIVKRDVEIHMLKMKISNLNQVNALYESEIDDFTGINLKLSITSTAIQNIRRIYELKEHQMQISIPATEVYYLKGDRFSWPRGMKEKYEMVKLDKTLDKLIELKNVTLSDGLVERGIFALIPIKKNTVLGNYTGRLFFGDSKPLSDYTGTVSVFISTKKNEVIRCLGPTGFRHEIYGSVDGEDDSEDDDNEVDYDDDDQEENDDDDDDEDDNNKNKSKKAVSEYQKVDFIVDAPSHWSGITNHKWEFYYKETPEQKLTDQAIVPARMEDNKYFANMVLLDDGSYLTTRDIEEGEEITWDYSSDLPVSKDHYWKTKDPPIWMINGISKETCDMMAENFIIMLNSSKTELTNYKRYIEELKDFDRLPEIIQKEIKDKGIEDLYDMVLQHRRTYKNYYAEAEQYDIEKYNEKEADADDSPDRKLTRIRDLRYSDLLAQNIDDVAKVLHEGITLIEESFKTKQTNLLMILDRVKKLIERTEALLRRIKSTEGKEYVFRSQTFKQAILACLIEEPFPLEIVYIESGNIEELVKLMHKQWEEMTKYVREMKLQMNDNEKRQKKEIEEYFSLRRESNKKIPREPKSKESEKAFSMLGRIDKLYGAYGLSSQDLAMSKNNKGILQLEFFYTHLGSYLTRKLNRNRKTNKDNNNNNTATTTVNDTTKDGTGSTTVNKPEKLKARSTVKIDLKNHILNIEDLATIRASWQLNSNNIMCSKSDVKSSLVNGLDRRVFDFNPSELDCMWDLPYKKREEDDDDVTDDTQKDSIMRSSDQIAIQKVDDFIAYIKKITVITKTWKKDGNISLLKPSDVTLILASLQKSLDILKYYRLYQRRLSDTDYQLKGETVRVLNYISACLSLLDYVCQLCIQAGSLKLEDNLKKAFLKVVSQPGTIEGRFGITQEISKTLSDRINTNDGVAAILSWYELLGPLVDNEHKSPITLMITSNVLVDQWVYEVRKLLKDNDTIPTHSLLNLPDTFDEAIKGFIGIGETLAVDTTTKLRDTTNSMIALDKIISINKYLTQVMKHKTSKRIELSREINNVLSLIKDSIEKEDFNLPPPLSKSKTSSISTRNWDSVVRKGLNYALTFYAHTINNVLYQNKEQLNRQEKDKLNPPSDDFRDKMALSYFKNYISKELKTKYKL